ncbi:DUF1833 family protein [Methylorubrum populi]
MTLKAALAESYASGDEDGVVVTAAQIDHESFETPIYVVTGLDTATGEPAETIGLPTEEGGPPVPHTPCAFSFVRTGADHDGPTDGKVQIDNVSDQLHGPLKGAIGYNEPIQVTFRQYRVLPGALAAVTGPDEVIEGLLLTTVDLTADTAEGTLSWPDGRDQNVPTGPNAFFDRATYPGLFT